jgi:hypothetical protein
MNTSTIYIKYDYFRHDQESVEAFCEEIGNKFRNYPWGAGFKLNNFRCDSKYFYFDITSDVYESDNTVFQNTLSYIQGVITGYLIKCGVEII